MFLIKDIKSVHTTVGVKSIELEKLGIFGYVSNNSIGFPQIVQRTLFSCFSPLESVFIQPV